MTSVDVAEMEISFKKRRMAEAILPDYVNKEPKRLTGMFHEKLVEECRKHYANMGRVEKYAG